VDPVAIGLLGAAGVMLVLYLKRRRSRLKNDDYR
jgi:hypothetical protein